MIDLYDQNQLKEMYNQVGSEVKLPEVPESLTAEKVLDCVQESMDENLKAMEEAIKKAGESENVEGEELKAGIKDEKSAIFKVFMEHYLNAAADIKQKLHEKHEIDEVGDDDSTLP